MPSAFRLESEPVVLMTRLAPFLGHAPGRYRRTGPSISSGPVPPPRATV